MRLVLKVFTNNLEAISQYRGVHYSYRYTTVYRFCSTFSGDIVNLLNFSELTNYNRLRHRILS